MITYQGPVKPRQISCTSFSGWARRQTHLRFVFAKQTTTFTADVLHGHGSGNTQDQALFACEIHRVQSTCCPGGSRGKPHFLPIRGPREALDGVIKAGGRLSVSLAIYDDNPAIVSCQHMVRECYLNSFR